MFDGGGGGVSCVDEWVYLSGMMGACDGGV